jgi:hypothetical protein
LNARLGGDRSADGFDVRFWDEPVCRGDEQTGSLAAVLFFELMSASGSVAVHM